MNSLLLVVPILLPLLGGGVIYALQLESRTLRQWCVGSIVVLNTIITWILLYYTKGEVLTIVTLTKGCTIALRIDGLSKVFAGLVATLWPLATCYAFEYMTHEGKENQFFTFYTATFGVTLGVAFSANLITMYLFYELLTLCTLPLIMHAMDERAIKAGKKYLKYSMAGASFAFIGIVFLTIYGTGGGFTLGGTLDVSKVASNETVLRFVYLITFLGFGVKAAIFPFHGWLPSAGVAPTPVTALLHAVAVVKAGVFALMRVTYFSFGAEFLNGTWVQWVTMLFAIITIVYGSTMALKETHLKRRLAYSTVSNLSYIVFAITLLCPSGFAAAMTHMIFHGIMKICLFFCVGIVLYKTHKEYIHEIKGFGKKMKKTFACFTIASVALVGVPLFTGFISKWNIATAAIDTGKPLAYVGVVGLLLSAVLTAAYLFSIVMDAYSPDREFCMASIEKVADPNFYMILPLILLCIAMIYFGLHAEPLMKMLQDIAVGIQ